MRTPRCAGWASTTRSWRRRKARSTWPASARAAADEYAGNAETLLIMMQQHNMKEENILYPMCDQHLGNDGGVLEQRLASEIGVS